ncbi:hypothetical protein V2J09_017643 [Rumex salicifolius]
MNCLIWNTQGAGSKGFRRACRYLIHRHKTDILVLSEPQISGVKAQEVCDSLNFSNNSCVEAVGASGGIWVLWNANETSGLIHAKVLCDSVIADFVFVYAPPSADRRVAFWTKFEEVISSISGPAFFGGDFNCILSLEDRRGGSGGLSPDSMTFADLVGRLDLIDMGFSGSSYTWNRGPKDAPTVSKRLDRWTDACVRHFPTIKSDHNPIYLTLSAANLVDRSRRPFRFESMWTLHPQFMPFVESKWQRSSSTITALSNLKTDLQGWNREVFGNLQYRKDKLFCRIEGVERALANGALTRLLKLQNRLKEELEDVLQQEEVLWFQKSREKWIEGGDRNTTFFHASAIVRRRRNHISALRDEENNWVIEKQNLEDMVVDFYKQLYTLPSTNMINAPLPHGGFPRIDSGDLLALLRPFSDDEIWNGVKGMGAHKAPGIDGFQPVFYHKCWVVVRESVTSFIRNFFSSGVLPTAANETILHLIGKVASPEMVSQFRPISLCNVIYKMITKILSKRLQPLMDKLVRPMQSSFIPGRVITDNIVLVQELVHSMNRKTGRKGWFIMKLDLEKAYDRLRWDFIEDTLRDTGIPDCWVQWIMECVSSPSMRVLWNGELTEPFTLTRGVRQGDSISPYHFVLCLERLSHLIAGEVDGGRWRPVRVCRNAPRISHIFFPDDIILAAEASEGQMRLIMQVLDRFFQASGQRVSTTKSTLYVSKNVGPDLVTRLESISGMSATTNFGRYLGMPVLQGKVTKATFAEVIVKANNKLAGWKCRTLSMAGRVTLARSVLSTLPFYTMNSVHLPKGTCEGLD